MGRLLPIEVKATRTPRLRDAKSLRVFRDEYADDTLPGLLVHAGDETEWIGDGILSIPWWRLI